VTSLTSDHRLDLGRVVAGGFSFELSLRADFDAQRG